MSNEKTLSRCIMGSNVESNSLQFGLYLRLKVEMSCNLLHSLLLYFYKHYYCWQCAIVANATGLFLYSSESTNNSLQSVFVFFHQNVLCFFQVGCLRQDSKAHRLLICCMYIEFFQGHPHTLCFQSLVFNYCMNR